MVELARRVLKNSLFNSISALIRGIGGFLFSVVIARILTPEQFGIYALAISVCFLLMQMDFGIGYSAVRYLAASEGDERLARGYFKFFFKLRIALGLIYAILLIALSDFLAFHVFKKPEISPPLKILAFFFLFFFLSDFIDCCFQAFQNFKYPAIRHAMNEFLKFALVIPLTLIFFNGVFVGLTLASTLTFILMFSLFRRRHSHLFKGTAKKIETKRVLRFMSFVSIGAISGVVFSYVDMIMLGIFLPAEYAGYYKAATNIIFGIAGLTGIAGVLFPVFTQLEGESLENAFKKVFRYASILSFPFAVSLAYFSPQVISVIYGVKYLPASLPLLVLSPLIIFNTANFFGVLFGAKEKPEYSTAISIASMAMNVLLNYILILRFGMIGAAMATTISRFFNILASGIIAWRKLNISPQTSSIYKPAFASIAMFLLLKTLPNPETLFFGLFELCLAIVFYFTLMFLIKGIEFEDLRYAKAILGIESFTFLNRDDTSR